MTSPMSLFALFGDKNSECVGIHQLSSFILLSFPCFLKFSWSCLKYRASQVTLVVENLPASAGDVRDTSSTPESGRSPAGGHGNPLQYSCLENSTDRGAWWARVHRVAKSQTQLKRLSTHSFEM